MQSIIIRPVDFHSLSVFSFAVIKKLNKSPHCKTDANAMRPA